MKEKGKIIGKAAIVIGGSVLLIGGLLTAGAIAFIKTIASEPFTKANGRKISDYDVSNNKEYSCFLNYYCTADNGTVTFADVLESTNERAIKIGFKYTESLTSYDFIYGYFTTMEGTKITDLFTEPVTCKIENQTGKVKFKGINKDVFKEKYNVEDFELRIIGQDANFTVHYTLERPSSKNIKTFDFDVRSDYDISENEIRDRKINSAISMINMKHLNGPWIGDAYYFEFCETGPYILYCYLSNSINDERVDLLDKPFCLTKPEGYIMRSDAISYYFYNTNTEYLESYKGNISLNLITNTITYIYDI